MIVSYHHLTTPMTPPIAASLGAAACCQGVMLPVCSLQSKPNSYKNRVYGYEIRLTMYLMVLDMPVASPSPREIPLCKILAPTSCKELQTTNITCSVMYVAAPCSICELCMWQRLAIRRTASKCASKAVDLLRFLCHTSPEYAAILQTPAHN